jgi:hypothetical protein
VEVVVTIKMTADELRLLQLAVSRVHYELDIEAQEKIAAKDKTYVDTEYEADKYERLRNLLSGESFVGKR